MKKQKVKRGCILLCVIALTAIGCSGKKDAQNDQAQVEAVTETAGGEIAASDLTQPAASTAASLYQIGDTGPNGGIVFSVSGGKYKEITKPGNEDSVAAMSDRYFEYHRIYNELYEEAWGEQTRTREAYDDDPTPENHALYEEATNKLDNVESNVSVPYPLSDWRWATMSEIIEVYDLFKKTGILNFGNVAYVSSSTVDDPDSIPPPSQVMDMRDGEIFLLPIEVDIYEEFRAGYKVSEKGIYYNDLLVPMVKEF